VTTPLDESRPPEILKGPSRRRRAGHVFAAAVPSVSSAGSLVLAAMPYRSASMKILYRRELILHAASANFCENERIECAAAYSPAGQIWPLLALA
jgi:hypothetical protein